MKKSLHTSKRLWKKKKKAALLFPSRASQVLGRMECQVLTVQDQGWCFLGFPSRLSLVSVSEELRPGRTGVERGRFAGKQLYLRPCLGAG